MFSGWVEVPLTWTAKGAQTKGVFTAFLRESQQVKEPKIRKQYFLTPSLFDKISLTFRYTYARIYPTPQNDFKNKKHKTYNQ